VKNRTKPHSPHTCVTKTVKYHSTSRYWFAVSHLLTARKTHQECATSKTGLFQGQ